jgi:hypothetical protein
MSGKRKDILSLCFIDLQFLACQTTCVYGSNELYVQFLLRRIEIGSMHRSLTNCAFVIGVDNKRNVFVCFKHYLHTMKTIFSPLHSSPWG